MSNDIQEAKQNLPLPALIQRLGLGEHAKKSGKCPFHDDRHNSFSVWRNGTGLWFWKCHTGCGEGDGITFLEKHYGISNKDATKLFLEMAGATGVAPTPRKAASASTSKSIPPLDWRACVEAFTDQHVHRLAQQRGYRIELVSWLKENGLIGCYDGCIAFPIRDESGKVVAAHYRLKEEERRRKNRDWERFPTGHKTRPIVIGELLPGESIHAFESQWDAFAFMEKSGERSGIVITLGAENGKLIAGLVPEGATVYAWKHNDELKNGKRAGDEWLKDVAQHAWKSCTVKVPKIPAAHKDLNDWTRAGAASDDLLQAMVLAETVREAEISWTDALNAAVVTSSELHNLALIPRRKLLADWFCEGDLGFIFAFRGVGKTWLALAIAQALSTAGKLGEWPAHEAVKVLYVDGEMPPDLMRTRCKGLQANNANLEFLNHEILFDRTGKTLNITNPEVQQAITAHCIKTSVKVLVLDNLSTLAFGMKENDADSWGELVNNWLLDLRRRKIAVIIVHHAGRSGEMRGTSKREDNVFWIIALDDMKKEADDKRGARFVSHFTKASRNTQHEVAAVEWHFVTEANGDVSISHRPAQTLDVFRTVIESGVTKCDEIADAMKLPRYTISRLAKRAIDAGWLKKRGRDYELIQTEKEGGK